MKKIFLPLFSLLFLSSMLHGASSDTDIAHLDRNMAIPTLKANGVAWYNALKPPFRLSGLAWFEKNGLLRRLPPERKQSKSVAKLSEHLTAATIAFKTDSPVVWVDVEFTTPFAPMWHFSPVGRSGMDLYSGGAGNWHTVGVLKLAVGKRSGRCRLFAAPAKSKKESREFLLNLPIYNGIKKLSIGVAESAKLEAPAPFANDKRIIIYGGSTVQGACASRPGRTHMNIIGRHFNMEVINLGFSGSGLLEPEIAELVSEIERPAVIILEGDRNAKLWRVKKYEPLFISIIRKRHPDVPIVVMQGNPRWKQPDPRTQVIAFQKAMVEKLKKAGDKNIYFWDCSDFLGDDYHECSVDGAHPTDLGFYRMSERMIRHLTPILK